VVLRSDRRPSPGGAGTAALAGGAFSAADVGRALRHERNRQGLSLRDVSVRTGIPEHQLRAAETGAFDQPDGLAALKTVRRFADLLGLPGDRFALAILEQWPTRGRALAAARAGSAEPFAPGGAPETAVHRTAVPPLQPTALVAPGAGAAAPGRRGGVAGGAGPDDRETVAVAVAAVDAWTGWRPGPVDSPYVPDAFGDTGMTPAVRGGEVWRPARRSAPTTVKALIVALALCVLAAGGLLAVGKLRPAWLRDIGLSRLPMASAPAHPARRAATPTQGPARARTTAASATLTLHRTSRTEAVVTVAAPYTAEVTAVGGPCWVQVTSSTSATPVFAGIVEPGAPRSFSSSGAMAVELGSTAGRFSLTSASGRISTRRPSVVPFRFLVRPAP
jgi:hypothetical protein